MVVELMATATRQKGPFVVAVKARVAHGGGYDRAIINLAFKSHLLPAVLPLSHLYLLFRQGEPLSTPNSIKSINQSLDAA